MTETSSDTSGSSNPRPPPGLFSRLCYIPHMARLYYKFTPEAVEAAKAYAAGGWRELGHMIPSVVGLAAHLDVTRRTIYDWAQDFDEIADVVERVNTHQELTLINGGLGGTLQPMLSKVLLGKHGYSEKVETDHTSSDKTMTPQSITLDAKTVKDIAKSLNDEC